MYAGLTGKALEVICFKKKKKSWKARMQVASPITCTGRSVSGSLCSDKEGLCVSEAGRR